MPPELIVEILSEALETTILVAAPLLVAALVVALLVGVLQAATQINELTLSFVPKLLAIAVALVLAGPWMLSVLVDLTRRLLSGIPGMIG